jgi:hypothetical protein
VLLIGTGGQYAFTAATTAGDCRLAVDGGALSGSFVSLGNQVAAVDVGAGNRNHADGFTTTVVTEPLSAGPHTFSMSCNETDADVEFENPQIAAAVLGSG